MPKAISLLPCAALPVEVEPGEEKMSQKIGAVTAIARL